MYSADHYPATADHNTYASGIQVLWSQLLSNFNLQAILLVEINLQEQDFRVVSSHALPSEPFNGSERIHLQELVTDCFAKYPKAHVHAASNLRIMKVVEHLSAKVKEATRVFFVPAKSYGRHYVFLGFPAAGNGEKNISTELLGELDLILCAVSFSTESNQNTRRLNVTEMFIKEIGHDMASSVQAIVAKLRTIRDGRLRDQDAIARKATEIENEINTMYGITDVLGLAIDLNYQLRSFVDCSVSKLISQARAQLYADANEHNIKFDVQHVPDNLRLWGDDRAIQQCFFQLFLNAIKYAYGGTAIRITVVPKSDSLAIHISNKGVPLPVGEEQKRIWDFGYRGKKAKEMHVNGSGVGLFTVRKITLAHRGRVWADGNGENTTFTVEFPRVERLKAELGLLV